MKDEKEFIRLILHRFRASSNSPRFEAQVSMFNTFEKRKEHCGNELDEASQLLVNGVRYPIHQDRAKS